MNLTPSVQLDDIYQIEQLDYVTADLANVQPQALLNRLSYIYYYRDTDIDNEKYADDLTVEGLWDDDNIIEQSIEEVESQSDAVDIVGTYTALQQYDTADLNINDIIKVLADENYDNLSTYYKWSGVSFIYQSYERKMTPVVLTQSANIVLVQDIIYIISGIGVTLSITCSSSIRVGTCITFLAVQTFTVTWTDIDLTQHSQVVLSGNSFQIYFDGNGFIQWKEDILDKVYPIGTVVFRTLNTQPPVGGTWELLPEGYILCPDTEDIGITNDCENPSVTPSSTTGNTNGTSISVAMLPSHTHTISGSLTSGGGHSHTFYGNNNSSTSYSKSGTGSTGITTYNTSGTTQSGSVSHYHSVSAALANSTQYTNTTPDAHTHPFTGTAGTINIMQASYALYAWKRTA